MDGNHHYVNKVPHGLGIRIPVTVEQYAPSVYVWRQFQKPDYWTDGGYGRRGLEGYVPTLPVGEWNDTSAALHASKEPDAFWLIGQDCQEMTHPTDAANFSAEWGAAVTALPGVRVSKDGLRWMDAYLDVGGLVPEAWHVHITAPWTQWAKEYRVFLAWMRARRVLRPVVVTGVEAGTIHRPAHMEFTKKMVREGLASLPFLNALFWSDVYDPHRWGASMLRHSMILCDLGKQWVSSQKEWRDANTGTRT